MANSQANKPLVLLTVMCQVWQVLLRDLEEVLTHMLMHGSSLSSSAAVLIHGSGTSQSCSNCWALSLVWDLQDPCPKSLFCSQTTPWNKLLVFSWFPPCPDLNHRTMTSFLSLREHSPATASHSPPWEPWNLPWLQQGGHGGTLKFLLPQSWHWFSRDLAAQSTQAPTVLTCLSPLQSQRHPNLLVLWCTTERRHHYACQPELPFSF